MAIDYIIATSDCENIVPNGIMAADIYDKTPEGSPLRKLVVDYLVHEAPPDLDLKTPHVFLLDVFREARRIHVSSSEAGNTKELGQYAIDRPPCYYHQHGETHPKSECEKTEDSGCESDGSDESDRGIEASE